MERYDSCLLEWYWAPPSHGDPNQFRPNFVAYFSNGERETQPGANGEVAAYLARLGQHGWRVVCAVNSANWILWTLERRV